MKIKLGTTVYHKDIYWGREPMKIVGIRADEVELEGDWSGGTHNVCQRDWVPIEGLLFEKAKSEFDNTNEDAEELSERQLTALSKIDMMLIALKQMKDGNDVSSIAYKLIRQDLKSLDLQIRNINNTTETPDK